jgi:hypothetical protein
MRTLVSDLTATTRKLKKCFVSDSGGTVRNVKKIFVSDPGGVTRLVFESTTVFTMVAGAGTTGPGISFVGFASTSTLSFGSISPSVDVNGNTVKELLFAVRASTIQYQVAIATNPGSSYISTLAIAGQSILNSSAANYSYLSGGVAQWSWFTGSNSFTNGNTYTVSVSF